MTTTPKETTMTPAMKALVERMEKAQREEAARAARYEAEAAKPAAERTWNQ